MAKRVSAIIPVRDGEEYVEEAIDSILSQSRPPDQVIVVDDGSSDGTVERVAGYGDAVELLRQDPRGVGAALNTALDAADGDLISFLDADDLWTERKLELQCEAIADPSVDVVFGRVEQFISPDLSAVERARLRTPRGSQPAKLKGAMLIDRAAVDRLGAFSTQWKVVEFVDWYARAQELGLREHMVDEVVLRRRLHKTNVGRRRPEARAEYAIAMAALLRRRRGA
jgi:glycosyltransferase involved in cell wall biosynthesis